MKLITYNVNGIRSSINKGLVDWLIENDPDILCLQEIKLFETELVEHLFTAIGYHCYWYPAQKKGYSGVAILSKKPANSITYGCGHPLFDDEGRSILAQYEGYSVFCNYFPSGTTGDIRQTVKMEFLDHIYKHIDDLKKTTETLIICGDVNICHTEIDIHNPKSNAKSSGFLPEERAWVSRFLENGFTDCFRNKVPDLHQYTWWSLRMGARSRNLGWRIDYVFVNNESKSKILSAKNRSETLFSDHCPVEIIFDL